MRNRALRFGMAGFEGSVDGGLPTRLAKGRRLDGRPLWWRPVTRAEWLLGCFGAAEQPTDFGLPVAAMATQGADARQLACLGPSGDGLGVNPEQRGHLCRGEQGLRCRPGLNIAIDRHGFQPLTRSLSLGTIGT